MDGMDMTAQSGTRHEYRALVTGATGIIGSWLVKELLAQGSYVVALVLDMDPQSELYRSGDVARVSVVNGRLEDFETLEQAINEYEVEAVFHLGAQPIVETAYRSPLPTFEANIRGTYNLLEACRLHADTVRRIVIASSDKAYAPSLEPPYTEDMPLAGTHPYNVSKSCADLIAQSYYHTYGLPVAIARCGNVYGGGDLNWNRIVPGTIRAFLAGQRPLIRSDGSYLRDYIYVKDVARAYTSLAEALDGDETKGEAFNFGHGKPVTVLELVGRIQQLMDCTHLEPRILNTAKGEVYAQYLSAAKAKEVLDWQPQYDLEHGLRETIECYRELLGV